MKKIKKVQKTFQKRLTLSQLNGIMFKLSISESVILIAPDSVEKGETKINNCIANSKMFLFSNEIKTSTKGKINFHISEVKLIWLIKQKTLKAILRLWLQLRN